MVLTTQRGEYLIKRTPRHMRTISPFYYKTPDNNIDNFLVLEGHLPAPSLSPLLFFLSLSHHHIITSPSLASSPLPRPPHSIPHY